MYLEHFGLRVNPFGISPRLDFLYKSGAFEEGMAHLMYGLENSEAIVMITGAIGTGKTMAVQSFLSYLGDRYLSALITNTCIDGRGLLKLILDDLDCPHPTGDDKSDLLIAFKQFLISAGKAGRRIIVVIDEAQNLSREVLEEVRLLTNMGQGDAQPVQVILVGQTELEETVNRPDLAQLRQRIRVHCRLTPLERAELAGYVAHRLQVAGCEAEVFTKQALDRIFAQSGGVPRVVNTLCDQSLLSAFVAGRQRVDGADVPTNIAVGAEAAQPSHPSATSQAPAATTAAADPPPATRAAAPPRRPVATAGNEFARSRRSDPRQGRARWLRILAIAAAGLMALAAWQWGPVKGMVNRLGGDLGERQTPTPTASGSGPGADVRLRQDAVTASTRGVIEGPHDANAGERAAVDNGVVERNVITQSAQDAAVIPQAQTEAPVTPIGAMAPLPIPDPDAVTAQREAVIDDAGNGANATDSIPCFLHVSSFRTARQARAVADGFASAGQPAVVHEQTVRDVLWYRVYLGPIDGRNAAIELADKLRADGRITYYKVVVPGVGGDL